MKKQCSLAEERVYKIMEAVYIPYKVLRNTFSTIVVKIVLFDFLLTRLKSKTAQYIYYPNVQKILSPRLRIIRQIHLFETILRRVIYYQTRLEYGMNIINSSY